MEVDNRGVERWWLSRWQPSKKEVEDNAIELGNWLVAETPPYKPTRTEFFPHVDFVETIYLNDLLEFDKKRLKKIIDEYEDDWPISSAFVIRWETIDENIAREMGSPTLSRISRQIPNGIPAKQSHRKAIGACDRSRAR
jgi:hypothetical protein